MLREHVMTKYDIQNDDTVVYKNSAKRLKTSGCLTGRKDNSPTAVVHGDSRSPSLAPHGEVANTCRNLRRCSDCGSDNLPPVGSRVTVAVWMMDEMMDHVCKYLSDLGERLRTLREHACLKRLGNAALTSYGRWLRTRSLVLLSFSVAFSALARPMSQLTHHHGNGQ